MTVYKQSNVSLISKRVITTTKLSLTVNKTIWEKNGFLSKCKRYISNISANLRDWSLITGRRREGGGGQVNKKRGADKDLAILKGEEYNKFWSSFYAIAFSHNN